MLDIHRDSIPADKTTIEVDGERYAKVAFVIGKEHKNYSKNYEVAKQVTKEMESRVQGITRPIIVKGGPEWMESTTKTCIQVLS